MAGRNMVARVLLAVYVLGTVVVVLPLVLDLAGDLSNTTSGKVLAAALIALGTGAGLALRDPWADRRVIQVLIVFTCLATVAILYRLAFEHHPRDLAWFVLPFAAAAPVLFAVFYPRPPEG
jgi:hypothetical protein